MHYFDLVPTQPDFLLKIEMHYGTDVAYVSSIIGKLEFEIVYFVMYNSSLNIHNSVGNRGWKSSLNNQNKNLIQTTLYSFATCSSSRYLPASLESAPPS